VDPQLEGPGGGVLLAAIDEAALQGQADDWLVAADTGHVVVLRTGPADEGAARKRIATGRAVVPNWEAARERIATGKAVVPNVEAARAPPLKRSSKRCTKCSISVLAQQ